MNEEPIRWEYKVLLLPQKIMDKPAKAEERLNLLGAEGWELVSANAKLGVLMGDAARALGVSMTYAFLKRPI